MKLESSDPAEKKQGWKIVRRDTCADVDGEIIAADDDTGECMVKDNNEAKTLNFGPHGIRIVRRGR